VWESNVVSIDKTPERAAAGTNPPLAQHRNGLYQSPVGLFTANICVANLSSGETFPPRGFAAALPVSRHRCTHFIAELALTS
jgi:hypothetical protein